jgi:hypothetical protein
LSGVGCSCCRIRARSSCCGGSRTLTSTVNVTRPPLISGRALGAIRIFSPSRIARNSCTCLWSIRCTVVRSGRRVRCHWCIRCNWSISGRRWHCGLRSPRSDRSFCCRSAVLAPTKTLLVTRPPSLTICAWSTSGIGSLLVVIRDSFTFGAIRVAICGRS